jgi:hypothetical protein
VAEKGGYSKTAGNEKTVIQVQWIFKSPIAPGKLDLSVYEGLEWVDVPIKLLIQVID